MTCVVGACASERPGGGLAFDAASDATDDAMVDATVHEAVEDTTPTPDTPTPPDTCTALRGA